MPGARASKPGGVSRDTTQSVLPCPVNDDDKQAGMQLRCLLQHICRGEHAFCHEGLATFCSPFSRSCNALMTQADQMAAWWQHIGRLMCCKQSWTLQVQACQTMQLESLRIEEIF